MDFSRFAKTLTRLHPGSGGGGTHVHRLVYSHYLQHFTTLRFACNMFRELHQVF